MRTRINRYAGTLLSAMVLLLATQLTRCGKGDPAPETSLQDEVEAKLTGMNWIMQSATVDGVDHTSVYSGLAIKFSPSQFTTTHGGVIWPALGAWSFSTLDGTTIKRDDGTEVKVEVTDQSLKLTLAWTKTTLGGRKASVKGLNVFSFVKG